MPDRLFNRGPDDGMTLIAQYDGGLCPQCGRKFERGDVLTAHDRRWHHQQCPTPNPPPWPDDESHT